MDSTTLDHEKGRETCQFSQGLLLIGFFGCLLFKVEIATITYSEEMDQAIGHILSHAELDALLEKCGVAKKPEPEMSDQ